MDRTELTADEPVVIEMAAVATLDRTLAEAARKNPDSPVFDRGLLSTWMSARRLIEGAGLTPAGV